MAPNSQTTSEGGKNLDPALQKGYLLAHPPPGEEICLTGMSGTFPNSKNIEEFKHNLFNKIDMVDDLETRWVNTHPEIPKRTGKVPHINKFDAGYFGLHHDQADQMDPMTRLVLEKSIEAIFDAGINPAELENTRTSVYVGVCASETESSMFERDLEESRHVLLGCMRAFMARRIQYFLKLNGPSMVIDTACSSSLYALENAYRALRNDEIDTAIVAGANLCLHPFVTLQFARMGVLSQDGCCKSFDARGNGYCRSESINAVLLQRAKDSRRVYAKVLHAKTNCDGYKDLGISYPSGEMQKLLLTEFYEECGIDPSILSFVEAHGTGTKVGDPEELSAIDDVFCTGREEPLLIGSTKSNIGHTEPASGICSLIKSIIGLETGYIPPNIHYSTPREGATILETGRARVVTEKIPLPGSNGLIGVNSFGFGGANGHCLIEWNTKVKVNGGKPIDDLPRLVCLSGRIPESITSLADAVNEKFDAEHIQLLHEIFKINVEAFLHRGYTIASKSGELGSSSRIYGGIPPSLILSFGSFGPTWRHFAQQLLVFPVFADTIQRIHKILLNTGINITDMIQNSKTLTTHPTVNYILGTVTLQIGIVEILKHLAVKPAVLVGCSIGELACAYFDGCLTLEQVVLTALEIANHLKDISRNSVTYVVKFPEDKVLPNLPKNVEITWSYTKHMAAITGEPTTVKNVATDFAKMGAEVTKISTDEVTLHSKNNARVESSLMSKLKKIISNAKPRSKLWFNNLPEVQSIAEYLVKSLYSTMTPKDLMKSKNLAALEVGEGNLNELLRHSSPRHLETVSFKVTNEDTELVTFLKALGNLYELGFNPQIQNLYPKVQYPVSRGTPMICNDIVWNFSEFNHMKYEVGRSKFDENSIFVSATKEMWSYVTGHVVDGRNLFPATGYLQIVWDCFSAQKCIVESQLAIVFENCRFHRATTVSDEKIQFTVSTQRATGNFEIIEGDTLVVGGTIRSLKEDEMKDLEISMPKDIGLSKGPPLKSKDIYKELRLRGYNYKGAFRRIEDCNLDATISHIKWDGNWVAFLDNMLQMKILTLDTRLLYVPTGIKRLSIDFKKHLQYVESFEEETPLLPVYILKDADIIMCGGIQIRGVMANAIARRKPPGQPVLEKYEFVPNETRITVEESMRVNMQLCLENLPGVKVNVAEVIDEATEENAEPLGDMILDAFGDLPLIRATVSIIDKTEADLPNVIIEEGAELSTQTECFVVVGSKLLQRPKELEEAFALLKKGGFILSREQLNYDPACQKIAELDIVTIHVTEKEKLVFFRKSLGSKKYTIIEISERDEKFEWLSKVQTTMKKRNDVIVYARNEELNGILGFFNCIKREPTGLNVNCVAVYGKEAPPFDPNHPFYKGQLKKNLAINIYKNGKWGTYRHLLLKQVEQVEAEHCFVNVTTRGDLSSLRWIEGNLDSKTSMDSEKRLVQVYYGSLNFRDIMLASGRLHADGVTTDRIQQECVQGFEFAGRDSTGKRVMGLNLGGALSTVIAADSYLLFDVPDCWTLEQAATIPVVYGTVLYALLERGRMRKGESILIHSGTGGVGQAAITVALANGCKVFTTVGTPEKRILIKKLFPQLTDRQIGNSRDLSFEKMINMETRGRGVDLVLNSLAEEKLIASVRCLARGGRFLEIGKFDMANNNKLKLMVLQKDCSFQGIMLDMFFSSHPSMKKKIGELLNEGLKNGSVKPLTTNVFKVNEIEEAFRFMATGKHTGKVMIQIRKEEPEKTISPVPVLSKGLVRYSCNPDGSYIIAGGLGGFGLELADWLVLRGAKKLILTSRSGIQTGYQAYRINIWKGYGVVVNISTVDITTKEGCEELIDEAEALGPIESIFNLAVVLRDSLLENQTPETFQISFGPKAMATKYLDEITRRRCPNLRHFVIFSSVSCGRGNPGQTNYGMANSVMEKICEKRKQDGYPALAIEWGAIGDVGLVAEMQEEHTEMEIGGTLQQRISNCLQVMDTFLRQKETAIVSSMVVAEKKTGGRADNLVDAAANILGFNRKTVSPHSTLAELGMDSMTAIEIKQTLERDFEVFLTAQDMRGMTLARLQLIQDAKDADKLEDVDTTKQPDEEGFVLIQMGLGNEQFSTIPVMSLPSLVNENDTNAPFVFCFPGIEGIISALEPLAAKLKARTIGLQFCFTLPAHNYNTLAKEAVQNIEKYAKPNDTVNILAHSWGTVIALEATAMLEKKGYTCSLICIDGSPEVVREAHRKQLATLTEVELEVKSLCNILNLYRVSQEDIREMADVMMKCPTFEDRVEKVVKVLQTILTLSPEYLTGAIHVCIARIKEALNYYPKYEKVKAPTRLFKPSSQFFISETADYNLPKQCSNFQGLKIIEGNHVTMLTKPELVDAINNIFSIQKPGNPMKQMAASKKSRGAVESA